MTLVTVSVAGSVTQNPEVIVGRESKSGTKVTFELKDDNSYEAIAKEQVVDGQQLRGLAKFHIDKNEETKDVTVALQ